MDDMSEKFATLFEQSPAIQNMRSGSIVSGTVESVYEDVVVVNAGLKSEGLIPIGQFRDEQGKLEVQVGDEVEVVLDAIENGLGETRLSREKAKWMRVWEHLQKAYDDKEAVEGKIMDRVKGGFIVDIQGVRAFLPGSLLDINVSRDFSSLQGKKLEFKIINIDPRHYNVVVSRRAALPGADGAQQRIEELEEGAVVTGVVKNMTEYGAFLDIGGIDGLLHVTDMSWKRIRNPAEVVSVGDEMQVKILKFDRTRNRISLGLKQMREDPWVSLIDRYPKSSRFQGKVTNVADYGCFVELEEGVEGLVHVSEMDWTRKNLHPRNLVDIGQTVEVEVLEVDKERRRISLGMKQCIENPWRTFELSHEKGDRVSGTIKALTDFGIFVSIEDGIDGLIHVSDLSWTENGEEALKKFDKQRGDSIEAVLLNVDVDRERISLGMRQLQEDPFAAFVADNVKGSMIRASVEKIESKQVKVSLAPGVSGWIRAAELSLDREVRDAREEKDIAVGQELDLKIANIDRKKRLIHLSLKAAQSQEQAAAVKKYSRESSEEKPKSSSFSALVLIKEHLSGRKKSPEKKSSE